MVEEDRRHHDQQQMEDQEEGDESGISAAAAVAVDGEVADQPSCWTPPSLRFDVPPHRLHHFCRQFRSSSPASNTNFLKSVKWSPDGSSFLTSSDDNTIRSFSLSASASAASADGEDSYDASLVIREAETVYDMCWYPYMSAADQSTCVFATTTRDHPIHLWDSATGLLRCTYRAYDAVDEITAAISLSFNPSAARIFAGYNKCIRVFDLHRPGREFQHHALHKDEATPSGIASSLAFSTARSTILAVGSYSHTTTLYAEDNMELLYVLHGQAGGVTQVLFSGDGNYLYTGGRKDPYILCWDVRNTVSLVHKFYRDSGGTNQRISFDIEPCGGHLATGGQDGFVHAYNLGTGQWAGGFQAAADTVNGFSFHPFLPLAVTSSGHRRFYSVDDYNEEDEEEDPKKRMMDLGYDENCASVWSFHSFSELETDVATCDEASIPDMNNN